MAHTFFFIAHHMACQARRKDKIECREFRRNSATIPDASHLAIYLRTPT